MLQIQLLTSDASAIDRAENAYYSGCLQKCAQSIQKVEYAKLCKIRTMQGSILAYSDPKKNPTLCLFLYFPYNFPHYTRLIRIFKKLHQAKFALFKFALNKDLLHVLSTSLLCASMVGILSIQIALFLPNIFLKLQYTLSHQ